MNAKLAETYQVEREVACAAYDEYRADLDALTDEGELLISPVSYLVNALDARLADEEATDEERCAAQLSVYAAAGAARQREEDEANA